MVHRTIVVITICIVLFSSYTPAADAQGWVAHCNKGSVYRCQTGGANELLWVGSSTACTARWSINGNYIYFMCTNGQIWSMNNNGSNAKKIYDGTIENHWGEWIPVISAYRPDPDYVFYGHEGTNGKLYKIHRTTGKATLVNTSYETLRGEVGISIDGKRAVARSDNALYKITLDNGSKTNRAVKYSGICSSSLSPNGNYMTKNTNDNTDIFHWDGGKWKTVDSYGDGKCDNNMFSVNSNDHITYWVKDKAGICVTNINDNTHTIIGSMEAYYPHFFLGDIPRTTHSVSPMKTEQHKTSKLFRKHYNGSSLVSFTTIGSGHHSLILVNSLGIFIRTFEGTGEKSYDVGDLTTGIYIVLMNQEGRRMAERLIVEK